MLTKKGRRGVYTPLSLSLSIFLTKQAEIQSSKSHWGLTYVSKFSTHDEYYRKELEDRYSILFSMKFSAMPKMYRLARSISQIKELPSAVQCFIIPVLIPRPSCFVKCPNPCHIPRAVSIILPVLNHHIRFQLSPFLQHYSPVLSIPLQMSGIMKFNS